MISIPLIKPRNRVLQRIVVQERYRERQSFSTFVYEGQYRGPVVHDRDQVAVLTWIEM